MRKLFYAALIAFSTSMALVSCTEEEVVPTTQDGSTSTGNSGGSGGGAGNGGI